MEIQTNVSPVTPFAGVQQDNSQIESKAAAQAVNQTVSQASAGIVVDLKSREQPLNVAFQRGIQTLSENLSVAVKPPQAPAGAEEAADKLTAVVAKAAAPLQANGASLSELQGLFDTARETINQAFSEGLKAAPKADNIPLQQARNLTEESLNNLESLVGLREA